MNLRTVVAVSLLGAISAGCSSVRVIDNGSGQNYYEGSFEYATKEGAINTYVAGKPFSNPGKNFTKSVTSMMYGATTGRDIKFVEASPNTSKYGFHIVIAFNSVTSISVEDVCADVRQLKTEPDRKTTSMQAIFCQGGYPISYARGFVDGLKSTSDPKFRDLVRQVAFAMIPGYDDNRSSGFTPD
jgi:hypothetical protein